MKNEKNIRRAITMTEVDADWMLDLEEALEIIHNEPKNATEEDIKNLEKIEKLIAEATKLATETAKRMNCTKSL